jgi:hypothetical protein
MVYSQTCLTGHLKLPLSNGHFETHPTNITIMSLNEHCLHLFNYILGSLFIYVYLTFKLPTQLVVFPIGDYLLS